MDVARMEQLAGVFAADVTTPGHPRCLNARNRTFQAVYCSR